MQSRFSFTPKLKNDIIEELNIVLPEDAANIAQALINLCRRSIVDSLSSNTPQNNPSKRKKRTNVHVTLNCAYCKNPYSVRESHALRSETHYCSRECFLAINKKGKLKQCLYCGKDMYVKECNAERGKYCSRDCHAKIRQKEKITILCKNCGTSFEELPTSHKQTFCSQQCSQVYRVGPNMHNYKGNHIDCTCLFCGTSFQIPESGLKRGYGKFCSATCRSRHTVEKQGGMVSSIEIAVKETLEMLGEKYYHQHRIGRFLVDFYLPDRNLVIEADGDYWHSLEKNKKNDLKKDQYMKEKHIHLARLRESDIRSSCSSLVVNTLDRFPLIEGRTHDVSTKSQDIAMQRSFEW